VIALRRVVVPGRDVVLAAPWRDILASGPSATVTTSFAATDAGEIVHRAEGIG
jgi:hypothetical protein